MNEYSTNNGVLMFVVLKNGGGLVVIPVVGGILYRMNAKPALLGLY